MLAEGRATGALKYVNLIARQTPGCLWLFAGEAPSNYASIPTACPAVLLFSDLSTGVKMSCADFDLFCKSSPLCRHNGEAAPGCRRYCWVMTWVSWIVGRSLARRFARHWHYVRSLCHIGGSRLYLLLSGLYTVTSLHSNLSSFFSLSSSMP